MVDVNIRLYNPDTDYPAVAENLRMAQLYDADRDTEERLRKFADSILVAELDSSVVGSVYMVENVVSTLFRLVVDERFRRQGIGTKLVETALELLADAGARDVELFFEAGDYDLDSWYASLGFSDGGFYRSKWRYTNKPVPPNGRNTEE